MDGLLNPVSQSYRKETRGRQDRPLLEELRPGEPKTAPRTSFKGSSADEALEILKNEPDYESLLSVLKYFIKEGASADAFKITSPGPLAASIVQILVTDIVPNYWVILKESEAGDGTSQRNKKKSDLGLLLDCLRSVTGLNAVLARMRALIQDKKGEGKEVKRTDTTLNLDIILDLLSALLHGDGSIKQIWTGATSGLDNTAKRRVLAQEVLVLLGNGKVISLAAEALDLLSKDAEGEKDKSRTWTADGAEYSRWLLRNIITSSKEASSEDETKLCSDLLGKALRLGHTESVIEMLLSELLRNDSEVTVIVQRLVACLPHGEQRKVIFTALKISPELFLRRLKISSISDDPVVSGLAGIINSLLKSDKSNVDHLITWLTSSTGAGLGDEVGIRRAVLAVVAQDRDSIVTVFEKSLSQFGDQLYIRHAPMLQQEVHTQVLLLSTSYAHKLAPIKVSQLVRSGSFMNMVSTRLSASQNRGRFLGMVVGEALSELVHGLDKRLDFHMEETKSDEAMWLKSLTKIIDRLGPFDSLLTKPAPSVASVPQSKEQKRQPKPSGVPTPSSTKPKMIIEEVDSEESEDDDLAAYAKPESDEEDSDDDPTMIRRDKPKAPVYVRDLIAYFRDTENYDRQKLALTTAPVLIRRKANYGTEVKEHANELASLLVGLEDKFELEGFYYLRIQGMVAIITAQPQQMGPWFGKTFFDGDYSVSQRASVLTVLGLGARELAGFETSEYASAASMPSKSLPERLEKLYLEPKSSTDQLQSGSSLKALPPNALDTISQDLTSGFLAPLAAKAADEATGPDVLKLSTFTSRLEKKGTITKSKPKLKARLRAIPNTTAQMIATSFFFPLTARFQAAVHSSAGRARGIVFQPFLLAQFLKTLALLLHAAGPSTLALPEMTAELWSLLLGSGVRAHCAGDLGVTHAVLFALLTLLDVNEGRMEDLCRNNGREVVETQEWVALVFEGTRGEDGGEENDVKMLAAGILIRLREGMDKYRILLMGDMIG